MQNLRKVILFFIAVAIFAFGFFMMRTLTRMKKDPPKREATEAKRFVKTQKVKNAVVKTFIEGTGRVLSRQKVALISEVQGKLHEGEVPLKKGQSFRKGQQLYKVDSREAELNLSAQKSQFLTSLAAILPDIKMDYPNHFETSLAYFNSIKVNEELPVLFPTDDNSFKTFIASKNVLNQYFSIKSAEERLRKYVYHAPFDGTYSMVLLEAGSVVNPGTTIAQIIHTGNYELEVPVASNEIAWVKKGGEVRLTNQDSGKEWKGKVTRISEYLDPNTQSVNVYIGIDSGETSIYDGMYLVAHIPGFEVENAIEIPRKAMISESEVYSVVEGNLKINQVTVKKLNAETAVIAGLADGEMVVIEPVVNGHENMPVQTSEPND